tara:strand:- start:310 stop:2004 length:1695 start_codon:yes stop_codon:yes gene_type:complete
MSYQILSLKWRPLTFDQIVGQGHVTQTLNNAISMDRLAQAFLFSGPRGVGKTTTARVLASTINNIDNHETCLDIIELDGASNRGIDEIREIRESVKFPPSTVKYKVYIIDEAHMLTEQAFNALLKTLEEPPSYIIFILATTDPQKMPQTILSRTQRYDFIRISSDIIIDRLQYILKEENINYENNAIELIAQKSDGSMRDALSMLDQIIAFSDSEITIDNLRTAVGLIDQEDMYSICEKIISQNADGAIEIFHSIIDSGVSSKLFINDLTTFLNDCMLLKINKNNKYNFMSENLKTKISKNLIFSIKDLLRMIKLGFGLSARLKFIENSKVSVEVLIVDYINIISSNSLYDSLNIPSDNMISDINVNSNTGKIDQKDIAQMIDTNVQIQETDKNKLRVESPDKMEEDINVASNLNSARGAVDSEEKSDSDINISDSEDIINSLNPSVDLIKSNWDSIIANLDKENSKLSSFFEETTAKEIKNSKLVLELDNGNQFIKKVLETDKSIIVGVIKDVCGFTLDVTIEMLDNKEEPANKIEENLDNKDEKDHPLLDDAINMFKGKIIS